MLPGVKPIYYTRDEYHQMIIKDHLSPEDRTELIEGEIIYMSPIGSRHAPCVNRLTAILNTLLNKQAVIRIQNPIQLSRFSEL